MDLSGVGALLGQPARAAMLLELLDGRARTATELADIADVSRATASSHLTQLTDGNLLRVEKQGRHRYFRLADPTVAETLESLLNLTAGAVQPARSNFGPKQDDLRRARMCYDHIAGHLGVAVTQSLIADGTLVEDDANFRMTPNGERRLVGFGIDVDAARRRRRHFARTCLDWSERRPHLAGSLGAAIADHLFQLGWINREAEGRSLRITAAGASGLNAAFGIEIPATR